MKPYDVTEIEQLLKMESDNFPPESDKWSILHSGEHVSLLAPHGGGYSVIPRDQFNAIVDWYMADQQESHNATPAQHETATDAENSHETDV